MPPPLCTALIQRLQLTPSRQMVLSRKRSTHPPVPLRLTPLALSTLLRLFVLLAASRMEANRNAQKFILSTFKLGEWLRLSPLFQSHRTFRTMHSYWTCQTNIPTWLLLLGRKEWLQFFVVCMYWGMPRWNGAIIVGSNYLNWPIGSLPATVLLFHSIKEQQLLNASISRPRFWKVICNTAGFLWRQQTAGQNDVTDL